MTLQPGDKLGPYEIVAPIGKGGMGEVYRAHDSRLNRDVAVKVSNAQFSERFTREARAIAALNHTNICHLYDVGPDYLVMEYVEGQDLRGPMDFADALPIIQQLIDGIEAAHEKNIIHRDLKPANIKITPEGVVKILDFGLAKAMEPPPSDDGKPENSPTLTMGATVAGTILGTAAYMAPEQAKGKAADKRSDIWSFGVIVYEMLTGKRLFQGESAVEILGGVLNQEPDITAAPVRVHQLLHWCLEKDRKKRLASISDARRLMEESETATVIAAAPKSRLGLAAWAMAGLFLLTTLGVSFVHLREQPPVAQSLRYRISTAGSETAQYPTLSPDGRNLAFVTSYGGPSELWVRAMDTLDARPLAGTDGATYPFWSPDGAYLGFFAGGKLKKVAITGGPSQTLCDVTSGRGGTWNREGVILFSPGPTSVIFRVPAAGGTQVPAIKPAGAGSVVGYRFPVFLPDGVHFLYDAISDKPDAAGVFVGSLDGAEAMRLLPDTSNALYAPPPGPGAAAHLLFRREDALMAQPFDATRLKTTGDMFPIAEQVLTTGNIGFGAFSVSENGMLVYRSSEAVSDRELIWMNRAGKRLGTLGKPGAFWGIAISPDEKTLAVSILNGSQRDIWLEDLGRGVLSRFTFRSGINRNPVWSPDSSRLIFALQPLSSGGTADIYQKPAGGNGQEELLLHAGINGFADDWSSDGKWIVYEQAGQKTATDLWLLPLGDRKPVPYLQTQFDEMAARFSPDGRWTAYQSNESGQFQVYVQTVPPSGAKYQISTSGGTYPRWRRDGKELFYISADRKLMAVPVKLGATVEAGTPQPLFPAPPFAGMQLAASFYAPMGDGQRFLVNAPAGGEATAAPPFTVVTNWQAAFKK